MALYEYDAQNDELKRIAGGTLFADAPIGFILPSFESITPQGFLKMTDTLANRTVSRTTYKELFDWATERDLIGTGKPFGVGDGSTTFVIPDGKEIAFKGIGEYEGTVGAHVKSGGLAIGEFIDDRVQTHTHGSVGGSGNGGQYINGTTTSLGDILVTDVCNQRTGATTEVKSLGCHYYIKAKNIGVPADFVSAIDDVIGDKLSYSTTEINTGKKWIDGKTIYSKVVNIGSLPNATYKTIQNVLSGVDNVISISGYATNNSDILPLPYVGSDANNTDAIQILVSDSKTSITVRCVAYNFSAFSGYVIIEYTKTTD